MHAIAATAAMLPPAPGRDELEAQVRQELNQIYDPCGQAMGVVIGIVDMGLIRRLSVEPAPEGYSVALTLRFTAPSCMYYFYFEQQVRERLAALPQITALAVDYDHEADWTPDDMNPHARMQLDARRKAAFIALDQLR